MNTLENDLAEAKDEITRLRVQCDAKDNVIEAHRAFRADATVALTAADDALFQLIDHPIIKDHCDECSALLKVRATIAKLGLEER